MSRKFVLSEKQREGISNRLEEIVIEYGYDTMSQFSKEYGIARGTFQHWIKNGKINLAFLFMFCDEFDIDLRWLLIGPRYPKHKKPTEK